jgi:hypothetical protein
MKKRLQKELEKFASIEHLHEYKTQKLAKKFEE